MKFAIISDVHGNLPALETVIEDARRQGAQSYIFVGDYCLSGPYPNECISFIRQMKNTYVIRGNEERYLENLIGKDQTDWTDGQMQISYWCFRNISKENLDYLVSLPLHIDFECNGIPIHVSHSSETYIDECEFREWGPALVAKRYQDTFTTQEILQNDICNSFEKSEMFQKEVSGLGKGIFIFGHSHVQWYYNAKNTHLINPGSCGLPLDAIKDSVPYAILNIEDDGQIQVKQRRIPFDKEGYIESLMQTKQYEEAYVWSKVIIKELSAAKEHLTFFLEYADKYAKKIKDDKRPFSIETWERAYELWNDSLDYTCKKTIDNNMYSD